MHDQFEECLNQLPESMAVSDELKKEVAEFAAELNPVLSKKYKMIKAMASLSFKLFGYDLIKREEELFIIDINYFPSFKNVEGIKRKVEECLGG